jgi:hypothetical protein
MLNLEDFKFSLSLEPPPPPKFKYYCQICLDKEAYQVTQCSKADRGRPVWLYYCENCRGVKRHHWLDTNECYPRTDLPNWVFDQDTPEFKFNYNSCNPHV